MVQVINRNPTFGELFGTGLGQGLSSGLQQLAQQKMQQVQQRNVSTNLEQLGIPQQQAQGIAQLPAELQQLYVKDLLAAPSQQFFAQEYARRSGQEPQQSSMQGQPQSSMQGQPEQGMQQQPAPRLTEKQFTDLIKAEQSERKIGALESKEVRKFLQPLAEKKQKLDQNIKNSRTIIELVRSGETFTGPGRAALNAIGIGNYFNRNASQDLLEKTLAEQAQGAGAAFNTSRLTNLDVNLYQKSLGTVANTKEGLIALSKNKILESKAEEAKIKAYREIINENKGKIPYNIDELAEQRAEPELKKYADKAQKNLQDAIKGTIRTTPKKKEQVFNTLNDLPTNLPIGSKVKDTQTENVLTWNGSQWS